MLKKLTFKKETISNLNSSTMAKVYGGDDPPPTATCTCETVCLHKCPTTDPGTTGATCIETLFYCP
jgi:natural product precursor